MPTCDRCGAGIEPRASFHYDAKTACRSHLLKFRSIGAVEVVRVGKREFIYSATRAEVDHVADLRVAGDRVAASAGAFAREAVPGYGSQTRGCGFGRRWSLWGLVLDDGLHRSFLAKAGTGDARRVALRHDGNATPG